MSDIDVEGVLTHFGIKGMRWGVRRSRTELETSSDHKTAMTAASKAKKGGTKVLSNKELQDLINRMNLEQQYSRVAPTPAGKKILRSGGKFAADVLVNVGKQQVAIIATKHATKAVAKILK